MIRTKGDAENDGARLELIHQGVLEVLDAYPPWALALEQVHSHVRHPRTAILMAHAQGRHHARSRHFGACRSTVTPPPGSRKRSREAARHPRTRCSTRSRRSWAWTCCREPHDVADACAVALSTSRSAGIGGPSRGSERTAPVNRTSRGVPGSRSSGTGSGSRRHVVDVSRYVACDRQHVRGRRPERSEKGRGVDGHSLHERRLCRGWVQSKSGDQRPDCVGGRSPLRERRDEGGSHFCPSALVSGAARACKSWASL